MFNKLGLNQVIGTKLAEAVPGTIIGLYSGASNQACAFRRSANEENSGTEMEKFVERKGKGYKSKTKEHVVVEVSNVKTPGMITYCHKDQTSRRFLTLGDFGNIPFSVVIDKDMLKVVSRFDLPNNDIMEINSSKSLNTTEHGVTLESEYTENSENNSFEELEEDLIRICKDDPIFFESVLLEKDQQ